MVFNMNKSILCFNELAEEVKVQGKSIVPMNFRKLDQGIKYLGFL
jgi:hypothetical protein